MPLPSRNSGEAFDDFMSRCMSSDTMRREFPEQAQRAAVCRRQAEKTPDMLIVDKDLETANIEVHEGERAVIAKISTISVDRDGDVMMPSGADLSDFNKNPVVLFGHKSDSLPVGKAVAIHRRPDSLLAKVVFASRPDNHPVTEEWVPDTLLDLFKQKILRAFSVGFMIQDARDATEKDVKRFGEEARRVITRWKLLEFSVVPVPSNQDALAVAVSKGWLREQSWVKDEIDIAEAARRFDEEAARQEQRARMFVVRKPAPLVLPSVPSAAS